MTNNRRRGDELEQNIYAATLMILRQEGYDQTTFTKIARQAQTSRTVLYRRWDSPFNLIHEALNAEQSEKPGSQFEVNTGSLRDDLIALGIFYIRHGDRYNDEFILAGVKELGQGSPIAKHFMVNIRRSNLAIMKIIDGNAIRRGEIKHSPSENVQLLLFELLRYHLLFVHDRDELDVAMMIDEIILPAYQAGGL
ncbi:TetR/AcrR family transcriptional regulator [Convivina intestini]|uniref:TetR/AcrR family transcriptional regulator n=1 Tax=Convivina intestini TaxID=1505726 RepID=UPI00200C48B0|nr:TetR/AcrR family transcriptional regulator [Convivina intestini]CAH1857063.1 putative HTH-type transcriptional regulator [Convivina intestini]